MLFKFILLSQVFTDVGKFCNNIVSRISCPFLQLCKMASCGKSDLLCIVIKLLIITYEMLFRICSPNLQCNQEILCYLNVRKLTLPNVKVHLRMELSCLN